MRKKHIAFALLGFFGLLNFPFTAAAQPVVASLAATGITATNATLNGTLTTGGLNTLAYFLYGLTPSYDSYGATTNLAATNTTLSVSNLIGGLSPGTTYHFLLVATNSAGIGSGMDLTFTTLPLPPVVATLAATGITSESAILNGTVNPGGAASGATFQFGVTTNYGSLGTTVFQAAGNTTEPVSQEIGPFAADTTYHFRLMATNSAGSINGADASFTTAFALPVVITLAASSVQAHGATLNGTFNPNGGTFAEYLFNYGITTNYGLSTLPIGMNPTNQTYPANVSITALVAGTVYYYELVGTNSLGGRSGSQMSFTTATGAPTAVTLAASGVTTNATLNGQITTGGLSTTAYFEYGATTSYGSYSTTNSLAATNQPLIVSNLISGLSNAATYHFRIVGVNSQGTVLGGDAAFTTTQIPTAAFHSTAASGSNVTIISAVNPNGGATAEYFEYGLTTNYGSFSATNFLPATNVASLVTTLIGGLLPATAYHFQLLAVNSAGTGSIGDLGITTQPLPPVVTTSAATGITTSNATLNGAVNPGNGAASAYFQYGLTTNYGSFSATNSLVATNITLAVSSLIGGLIPGTAIHYQLVGVNSAGTVASADASFTASGGAATVTTLWATGVSTSSATLNGTITTGGSNTKVYFRYGFTTNYTNFTATNSLAGTNTTLSISSLASSLSYPNVYHFQLVASNATGTAQGADFTFMTLTPPPVVTTLPATGITATNATLNATVNPEGGYTTVYFQFGLTTNYGYVGDYGVLPSTSNVTVTLPGFVASIPGAPGTIFNDATNTVASWNLISCDAHCTHLAAGYGQMELSSDGGASWGSTGFLDSMPWQGAAFSADGTLLAICANGIGVTLTYIYVTRDGGATFTQSSAPAGEWTSIACSADGTRLAATASDGGIWTSTDGGMTFAQSSAPVELWNSIACSADGTRLAAASFAGIWTSTNSGTTWAQSSASPPGIIWQSIAGSADGTRLVVGGTSGEGTGPVWTSADGGATWADSSDGYAYKVASSADGMRLASAESVGGAEEFGWVNVSTNGGLTWVRAGADETPWNAIASSADGAKLAAAAFDGPIALSTGPAIGFTPGGTVYHYRVVGINTGGVSYGNDMTFATSPIAPLVSTLAAGNVMATSATLNGAVNPDAAATKAYFQYGLTTSYGSVSATNSLASTNVTLSVSNLLNGLTPATNYHYQLVGINAFGTSLGGDLTFTTGFLAPTATTLAASGITAEIATLHAMVNPNGAGATAYFQYGLTTNYGSFTVTNTLSATNTPLALSALISGLAAGTAYHFQIVAINIGGISAGADQTFTAGSSAPTMTTLTPTAVTATNATLNGTVNPNGAATKAYFQYGLTTNYGSFSATNNLTATNTTLSVSDSISGLAAGTNYHFRIVGTNSAGSSVGGDLTFTAVATLPVSFKIFGTIEKPGGAFLLTFTNLSGVAFTVLGTSNLGLPLSNWTVLGTPVESPPSQYQFTDSQATNKLWQYYRVRSP